MQYRFQLLLLLHGTVMTFIGLLAGVPLMLAIDLNWGAFYVHTWSVAHTSVTLTGVAFVAISAAFDHLVHGPIEAAMLVRSLLLCAYTFTIALMISGVAGVSGMAPGAPALNMIVFILFVIGALAVIFGVGIMIAGAYRAFRQANSTPVGTSQTS